MSADPEPAEPKAEPQSAPALQFPSWGALTSSFSAGLATTLDYVKETAVKAAKVRLGVTCRTLSLFHAITRQLKKRRKRGWATLRRSGRTSCARNAKHSNTLPTVCISKLTRYGLDQHTLPDFPDAEPVWKDGSGNEEELRKQILSLSTVGCYDVIISAI